MDSHTLELPHTAGCLVCGRDNPHGLRLDLHVEPESSVVRVRFVPRSEHIGFEGIVHGGVLATVLDEAMVWAATWAGRRFCVAGEMTIRFRSSAGVGEPLRVEAKVESARPRLVATSGTIHDDSGRLVATASGKYVPVDVARHRAVIETLLHEPATAAAAKVLQSE